MATRRHAVPSLPPKESLILELLFRGEGMYGLELVAASGGHLKRGTVYVTLGRMEEKGYVRARSEPAKPDGGGLPRRIYEVTPYGRRALTAWTHIAQQLVPELAR